MIQHPDGPMIGGRSSSRRFLTAVIVCCTLAFAAAASAQVPMKIGTSSNTLNAGPLLLANTMPEIFGARGMKLEVVDFRGSAANCVTAVISRAVDLCMVGHTTANDAIAEGAAMKVLAVTTRPMSEIFVSAKTVAKLGLPPQSSANDRLRALKGLRIVSSGPGSTHWTYLGVMMERVGMTIKDVNFTTLIDPIAMMQSVRNNQIDGAMWSVGSLGALLSDKAGVRWISMTRGDAPELNDVPFVGVYALTSWVEKNGELAAKAHAAFVDATDRMKKEPATASKAIKAKYYPDLDQAVWDDAFSNALPAFFDGAKVPKAGWDKLLQLQAKNTKKDYANVAFEKVVLPAARAN